MSLKDLAEERKSVVAIFIVTILIASSVIAFPYTARPAEAQQVQGKNWQYVNYDKLATGFNPQTQITKDNIQFLEIKWVYPFPQAPTTLGGYPVRGPGAISTPLVVDGILYEVTNYGDVIALDAATGKLVWRYTMVLNRTQDERIAGGLPLFPIATGRGAGHVHGINYYEGKLYIPTPPCDIQVVDAANGRLVQRISQMCVDVPGNTGLYKGTQSYGPVAYEKGRVLIVPAGPVDETNNGGRGFFAGYSMDTGQLLWRWFVAPPSGGDPEWALKECSKGWIQGIRCTDIPREILLNDWGQAGAKGGQAGPSWGQYPVDEETGIVYVATSQPAPDFNATYRPGPNIYSNSIVALNAMTGELVWYHQMTAHDLWDWDSAWNLILSKLGDRKVLYKGSKNGILYAFDAADGRIIWQFDAFTQVQKTRCVPNCYLLDPMNPADMKKPWQNYPSTEPFWMNPPSSGGIEADITLAYGRVYVATYNLWGYLRIGPVEYIKGRPAPGLGGNIALPAAETRPSKTTIYALDAATGKVVWSFFIPDIGYRGGLVSSGGLIFASGLNGGIYAIDAETGKPVWQKFLGTPMIIPPTIAADANGKMKLFQVIGGQGIPQFGSGTPGAIIGFGLPDKIPEPQVVTKEIVKEVVKEVPKEVVTQVTVETISPISYAVLGLGVVLIIVGGVLISRRRKPALS